MPASLLASIIVPVWRDQKALAALLHELVPGGSGEIIVAVPWGERQQFQHQETGPTPFRVVEAPRGRASQMNAGAAVARGRWLVFLHADSRLPDEWESVLAQADAHEGTAGGAFRFALDSTDWRARVLEVAVRARVSLLRLPYGDQGIFVRRSVFEALGGYADLPLMEDVDLIRRLRRQGRLLFPAAEVRTSARRWQRDGWVRRSATNVTLLAGYALGASPARLAQHYFHRRPSAVVVMARAPWTGGKTRIQAGDAHAHAALREALLLDTLDAVRSAAVGDVLVACDPPSETERMRTTIGGGSDLFAQRGESLGARMAHAFEDAFRLGYESVLLIGSDLPDLPARVLSAGWTWLARARGQVVLGPAADGGYYLIGLTRPHPELFEGIEWSTGTVLQETEAIAARLGLASNRVDQWWDVDTADDLERLSHSATGGAERTRAWILRHGAEVIAGRR